MLLLPISYVYGGVTWLRNFLFDIGVLPSKSFEEVAIICVGNLSVGGTGKSPHVENLIALLSGRYKIATLSRGYGRNTSGFVLANENSTSAQIGDEPLQFKRKFPTIPVAVDASRVHGVKEIMKLYPETEIILLDDAFQHRSIKPGFSILLTDYFAPYFEDQMLPSGNLREFSGGAKRANAIIITKTPTNITAIEKRRVTYEINPTPYQKTYFSHITYGSLQPVFKNEFTRNANIEHYFSNNYHVLLISGIANPKPLEKYLKERVRNVDVVAYPDHHDYSMVEMMNLKVQFEKINAENKIIVTTEKDAMRIDKPGLTEVISHLPIFYLPITIEFQQNDKEEFTKQILEYVKEHSANSKLHSK